MKRKQGPVPRPHSSLVVDGVKQTPSRAMLRAVGFTDKDFTKPEIGIASTWSNLTPCNMHIDGLAKQAAHGVEKGGGKPLTFGTITVSDGISMGTPGMRYSLVSREVIADSIETVVGAQGFDGLVAIGGCDKNMPGCMMAIARLNRPAVFVYGGTIRPGAGHTDIVSVFEAVGGHARGAVTDRELHAIECKAIPGPGSCGGMYTANTMASAIEALGMSLPNSSAQEAVSHAKREDCLRAGEAVVNLVRLGHPPARHHDPSRLRECDHRGDRTGRQHECRAAPPRDGPFSRRAPLPGRLHAYRQARAGPGGPAAQRPVPDVRADRGRRDPSADEDPARRLPAAWRVPDGDRQDDGGGTGRRDDPIPPARTSSGRWTTRSRPTVTWW